MANDVNSQGQSFSEMQIDAVGEILNISMGSAATAVSELLDAKVWITTPKVEIKKVDELNYAKFEPAIAVKIVYLSGISGSNLLILKQSDVQLILNQLMGMPLVVTDDFKFDELNISAVGEVMNQMMGASATALADLLATPIDISTPEPHVLEDSNLGGLSGLDLEETIAAITFNLTIDGIIKSEFMSILSLDLARSLADKMLSSAEAPAMPASEPAPTAAPAPIPAPTPQPMPVHNTPPMYDQAPPPMPQYHQPQQQVVYQNPVNIKAAQLQEFDAPSFTLPQEQQDNLQLLMTVPLNITVEIGSARKKVKEILEFSQGTIIELDRQAGAPVDVIVNGNLIAKGDVVVVDDNFAVRITEIVKSKFIDTLGGKE